MFKSFKNLVMVSQARKSKYRKISVSIPLAQLTRCFEPRAVEECSVSRVEATNEKIICFLLGHLR